jgi:hypothetical protein
MVQVVESLESGRKKKKKSNRKKKTDLGWTVNSFIKNILKHNLL